jgi:hypothetical protein
MGLLLEIAGNVPVAWVLFSHRTGQCHIHSEWLLSLPKCNSLFTLDTISAWLFSINTCSCFISQMYFLVKNTG